MPFQGSGTAQKIQHLFGFRRVLRVQRQRRHRQGGNLLRHSQSSLGHGFQLIQDFWQGVQRDFTYLGTSFSLVFSFILSRIARQAYDCFDEGRFSNK